MKRVRQARATIALLLLAVIMIGAGVYCSSRPQWMMRVDVRMYNEGIVAYQAPPGMLGASAWRPVEGPIERAVACFQKVASETSDPRVKSLALYNLGTIAGREAHTLSQTGTRQVGATQAVSKLAEAIRIDPNNEDAKYNLEVIEKLLVAVEEDKGGRGPGYAPGQVEKGY